MGGELLYFSMERPDSAPTIMQDDALVVDASNDPRPHPLARCIGILKESSLLEWRHCRHPGVNSTNSKVRGVAPARVTRAFAFGSEFPGGKSQSFVASRQRMLRVAVLSRQTQLRSLTTPAEVEPLTRLEIGPGGFAKLTLTRPKKLNSLSLSMMSELKQRYAEIVGAGARCLFLSGEGRAFCAGGDVAEVRDGVLAGNSTPADFFFEEYQLDYDIAMLHQNKGVLQIAVWDGIVMGGGVGLSIHSPIRIATEKTIFAMPETGIGLFPDVGTTCVLPRLPAGAHFGMFLGLTGQRLYAADCLYAGIATHYCPSAQLGELEQRIRAMGDGVADLDAVSTTICTFVGRANPDAAKAVLETNAVAIEHCFGGSSASAEDILSRLESQGTAWAKGVLSSLRRVSPTSVRITLEAFRRHQSASLKEAFTTEYRMSQWCMRPQPDSDFCEGIRAVLIDKDNKPSWNPASIEEVSKQRVDGFFAPLGASHPRGELCI